MDPHSEAGRISDILPCAAGTPARSPCSGWWSTVSPITVGGRPTRPRVDLKDAVLALRSIRLPNFRRHPRADATIGRPSGTESTWVAASAAILVSGCVALAAVLI